MKRVSGVDLGAKVVAALGLCSMAAFAQKTTLDTTLAALDQSSAKFVSAQAAFHKDLYTAAVKDHDLQDGVTYTRRSGGESEVGIKIVGAGARTVVYRKGEARDYTPGINCYNSYSANKSKGTIESLLALSFGASGKELAANWTISDLGPETIDNVKVEKLDLVPKEQGLKNNIAHVMLWTDLTRAVSLKQIVFAPTGDTQTATYSNIQLNKKVDTAPFEIKGKLCGK